MFSLCRTYYAEVLMWHAEWEAAETQLVSAASEVAAIRPGRDVDALVRLAELRRRQGRTAEGERLVTATEAHRLASLVAGALVLDRGDVAEAVEAAQRFLRRVGECDRIERVAGLELMVAAAVAAGDTAGASAACAELAAIAEACPTDPLRRRRGGRGGHAMNLAGRPTTPSAP